MRLSTLLALTLSTSSILGATDALTQETQFPEVATAFTGVPPTLISAETTFDSAESWFARYHFTINLPENAVESLGKVTIQQQRGLENIVFELQQTSAFEGTPKNQGKQLTLKDVAEDQQTRTISITLAPPVPPGTTFTVSLKPRRNPKWGGVYQFRVTAFPPGENTSGLDLGVGRLTFVDQSGF